MPYTVVMNEKKRYPFCFSTLMLILFWAGLLLALAGFALTVWRFAAFLADGAPSPYGWAQYAILFLMFDVETVFLFAWAVVVQDLGIYGLVSVLFFLLILVLGLAYAWRKGALEWK